MRCAPLGTKVVMLLFQVRSHKRVCVTRCARLSIDVKWTFFYTMFYAPKVYSNADCGNNLFPATKILTKMLDQSHLLDLIAVFLILRALGQKQAVPEHAACPPCE